MLLHIRDSFKKDFTESIEKLPHNSLGSLEEASTLFTNLGKSFIKNCCMLFNPSSIGGME